MTDEFNDDVPPDDRTPALEDINLKLRASITNKDIRQVLVELTKSRAIKLLDTFSDKDLDDVTISLIGTSQNQVHILRRWLSELVVPIVVDTVMETLKEKPDDGGVEAGKEGGKPDGDGAALETPPKP